MVNAKVNKVIIEHKKGLKGAKTAQKALFLHKVLAETLNRS